MFADRLITPEIINRWLTCEQTQTAKMLLASWEPTAKLTRQQYAIVRNYLMMQLSINNACRADAHIRLTNGAIRDAQIVGTRRVYTVSMTHICPTLFAYIRGPTLKQ